MPEWSAYFTQQKIGLRQNTEGCSCVLVMIIARQEAESGAWPPLPTFPRLASLNLPKASSQLKGKLQQWVSQELRYTLQLGPNDRGRNIEARQLKLAVSIIKKKTATDIPLASPNPPCLHLSGWFGRKDHSTASGFWRGTGTSRTL